MVVTMGAPLLGRRIPGPPSLSASASKAAAVAAAARPAPSPVLRPQASAKPEAGPIVLSRQVAVPPIALPTVAPKKLRPIAAFGGGGGGGASSAPSSPLVVPVVEAPRVDAAAPSSASFDAAPSSASFDAPPPAANHAVKIAIGVGVAAVIAAGVAWWALR